MDESIFGDNKKLKNAIMRRVYFFWFLRQFQSPIILNAVLFWAFVSVLRPLVNFSDVLANFSASAGNLQSAAAFIFSAFLHAHTGILTSLVFTSTTGLLMSFYFVKGVVRRDLRSEMSFKR